MSTFYQEYDRRSTSINYGSEPLGGFSFPLNEPILKFDKMLSQRNLCISQKMPELEPFILGLSTPLINKTKEEIKNSIESKEHFLANSFHTTTIDFNKYERRNVLCGTNKKDSNDIYLYSVNELGQQKNFYEYVFEYDEAEYHTEIPNYCLKKRHKLKEKSATKMYESSNPILETLIYHDDCYEDKIWLRTTNTLDVFDCQKREAQTVYNNYVKTFTQIPYISDEICFIDSSGLAWYGGIETSNYARMKFTEPLSNITTTDSPRTFYGSNDDCVFEFDYREYVEAQYNPVIQQKNIMDDWPQNIYDEFHIDGQPIFKIKYLLTPVEQTNTLIVVTNRFYIIFDSRFISRPILRLSHCIYDGGEYVHFTQKGLNFNSSTNGDLKGKLYMIYNLSKNVEPGVWYNSLFYNEKEDVFSSTVPICELPNFENVALYFNNKLTEELIDYEKKIDDLTDGVYARSICHVSPSQNSEEAFIFRSNSDGSIWYDEVVFNAHSLDFNEINTSAINRCHNFWNNQSLSLIKGYVDDESFKYMKNINYIWDRLHPYQKEDNHKLRYVETDFNDTSDDDESNFTNMGIVKNIKEKTNLSGIIDVKKEMPKENELSNIVLDRIKFVEKSIDIIFTE
uniref:Endonuclease III homolog n=1 Tax=Strongyloides stercoralis TaxID=6248 RepID=A0A0K0E3D4_STRER